VKYVVFYESAENVAAKAPLHMEAHSALIDEFAGKGELQLIGTFADPQKDGAMCLFRTREGAEAFVARDPFVRNGVVKAWTIKEWREILGKD
jgi:hypothetical protein